MSEEFGSLPQLLPGLRRLAFSMSFWFWRASFVNGGCDRLHLLILKTEELHQGHCLKLARVNLLKERLQGSDWWCDPILQCAVKLFKLRLQILSSVRFRGGGIAAEMASASALCLVTILVLHAFHRSIRPAMTTTSRPRSRLQWSTGVCLQLLLRSHWIC